MKPHRTKPGFEFVFSLSLIAIIALPPLVFAQSKTKNMEIRITNGDTVINGKNIKELSPNERKQALKDIDNLGNIRSMENGRQHVIIKKRSGNKTEPGDIIIERRLLENGDKDASMANEPHFTDSTGHIFKFRMNRPNDKDSSFTFNYKLNTDAGDRFEERDRHFDSSVRGPRMEFYRHRNIQNFEYTNTGSDGISTHVSFRITEPSPERLKALTGSEKAELEIKDLTLVPEFSAGKTVLMFGLPSKSIAEVKLTDNEGKPIWTDKAANGSFNKSFVLGLNGVYFLQIKQGGKVALKRIMKGE